jgi:tRNA threonylcarbamoyladenosine modification (KEOPS) complex  Pcc1 subunit
MLLRNAKTANFSASFSIKGDEAFLKACFEALKPETSFKTERARYTLKLDKAHKTLLIKISAIDATALRAAATTIVGLLSVVEKAWKAK